MRVGLIAHDTKKKLMQNQEKQKSLQMKKL